MNSSNFKGILLTNYSLINYSLVFAFIAINFFTERDSGFRNTASNVILIFMITLLTVKIVETHGRVSLLRNRDENSLKIISSIIIRVLLILAILLAVYFFS